MWISVLEISATSLALLFVLMCGVWLWFRRIDNAAVVDVGWGNGFAIAAAVSFVLAPGAFERKLLLTLLVVIWGERLTIHLLRDRVLGGRPEDGRYREMRARWKTDLPRKFFYFFQFQTLLVVVLSVPFFVAMQNPSPEIAPLEWAGAAIWLLGVVGESAADAQLRRFKARPENAGRTCREGLWRLSRHPNYFFEWVIWVGYAVFALASPWGWTGIISAAGMWYILTRLTGIPLTEEQAIRTRGDDYRRYQRTTNAFVPWFPKTDKGS